MNDIWAYGIGGAITLALAYIGVRITRLLKNQISIPKRVQRLEDAVDKEEGWKIWLCESVVALLNSSEANLLVQKDRCSDCPSNHPSAIDSLDNSLEKIREQINGATKFLRKELAS